MRASAIVCACARTRTRARASVCGCVLSVSARERKSDGERESVCVCERVTARVRVPLAQKARRVPKQSIAVLPGTTPEVLVPRVPTPHGVLDEKK